MMRSTVGLNEGGDALEETKRAQYAVASLDQVVARETGELAKLRDERRVDLADDLVHAGRVDTFVPTNGGMHLMLLLWVLRGRASEWAHCGGQARGHSRRGSARASTASSRRHQRQAGAPGHCEKQDGGPGEDPESSDRNSDSERL